MALSHAAGGIRRARDVTCGIDGKNTTAHHRMPHSRRLGQSPDNTNQTLKRITQTPCSASSKPRLRHRDSAAVARPQRIRHAHAAPRRPPPEHYLLSRNGYFSLKMS